MTSVQLSMGIPSFSAEPPPSWEHLTDWAQLLEGCGFDRVLVSEHIAFGAHMDAYANPATGGTAGGRQPTGPDGHWLEPLTTLTYLVARTERIRLGTNILLAALRPAAMLAKTLATMDVLSGGRIDIGVGVGWQREEYEAAGVDFDRRGAVLDQTLEVCQRLWRENEVSFESAGLNFERIHQMPKPAQPGGGADLGEWDGQPGGRPAAGALRSGLDSLGSRRARCRRGNRADARGGGTCRWRPERFRRSGRAAGQS